MLVVVVAAEVAEVLVESRKPLTNKNKELNHGRKYEQTCKESLGQPCATYTNIAWTNFGNHSHQTVVNVCSFLLTWTRHFGLRKRLVSRMYYIFILGVCVVCTSVELNVCLRLCLLVYMSKIEGYISHKRNREGGRWKENCTLDFHFVIRI